MKQRKKIDSSILQTNPKQSDNKKAKQIRMEWLAIIRYRRKRACSENLSVKSNTASRFVKSLVCSHSGKAYSLQE